MSLTSPTRPRWFFVSDPHWASGGGEDNFGPAHGKADADLIQFAESTGPDRNIVVAGDGGELWQSDWESILKAHGEAIECLMAHTLAYVEGNHDHGLLGKKIFGVEVVPYYFDKESGLAVIHGHQYDELVQHWRWLAQAGSWLFGQAERVFRKAENRRAWRERGLAYLAHTGRHGSNESYIRAIVKAFEQETWCKTVVFGHTHCRMDWTQVGRLQVGNAGTWTDGKRDVLEID